MQYRAVIFDLGGVVLPSPFEAFRAYERRVGLPHRFLSEVIVASGDAGAWSRLERGELDAAAFARAFEAECAAAGGAVVVDDLFSGLRTGDGGPRSEMVTAIRGLRAHGVRTAALTNNWVDPAGETLTSDTSPLAAQMVELFDVIVESARVGLRKPDPRIYELTCHRLGVSPTECVFLDDLGANLKSARALGMATIKVVEPRTALQELARLVGLPLDQEPAAP
jgi:putative hydrolase of the HAD superfamily